MNKKVQVIIQARLGSTRLPYKMMLSLHGKPIIEWVVKRVQQSKLVDNIIVAIPNTEDNNLLEKYLHNLNVDVFRGSEGNVLERFYHSVQNKDITHIVRVCADNPLIDPLEIDNLIEFYFNEECDYAYNHIPRNNKYPDGLGAEIISYELLEMMYNSVSLQHHKEHCFSYIVENENLFTIKTFNPINKKLHRPDLRFDIDTFDDYYKLSMKEIDISISSVELIKLFSENQNEARRVI